MDLVLYETGSGGDLLLTGIDLEIAKGLENILYMSMFGGADWWGNEFLEPLQQFNSQTGPALLKYALNSSGRLEIEKAINADLQIITTNVPGTTVTVETKIVIDNKLSIVITVDGKTFSYLWDPSKRFLNYLI
jgi:hypothetical protein